MPGYKQEKYAPEKTEEVPTLGERFVDLGLTSRDYVYLLIIGLAYYYRAQMGPRTALAVGALAAFLLLRRRVGLGPKEAYCSACQK